MIKQGELVELEIEDLNHKGEGVGKVEGKVVFVPDTVVGDRLLVRLVRDKKSYYVGKLIKILINSPKRIRPPCIVADKCGGCQWQHIAYDYQIAVKRQQVIDNLTRIGGFVSTEVGETIVTAESLGYRNKATYPLGLSLQKQVQAGYYRRGTHKLVNINQCPIQDPRLNPLLAAVKQDIQHQGWSIDEQLNGNGQIRHLSLRIGKRTGEILLTLVTTSWDLSGIEDQADAWLKSYPNLVGVAMNLNQSHTNVIFGPETRTIKGQAYLREIFGGYEFHLLPDTFFQVNTETAEAVLELIKNRLPLQRNKLLIDAYCGIGTFTIPLARFVGEAIGIELHESSVIQARHNAAINKISNISFHAGTVEALLRKLPTPDVLLLDPPRKGCDRLVIDTILDTLPKYLIYLSCQPATLARDLKLLCKNNAYRLVYSQPADFFPQTAHTEVIAFLENE